MWIRSYKESDKVIIEEALNNDAEWKEALLEMWYFKFEYKLWYYDSCFVAIKDEKIAGFIYISVNTGARTIIVKDLYIFKEYRWCGFWKELIEKAEYFCELFDINVISLNVLEYNEKVISFYERCWFHKVWEAKFWTWYKWKHVSNFQMAKIIQKK